MVPAHAVDDRHLLIHAYVMYHTIDITDSEDAVTSVFLIG